jgi:hypothetical protein
VFKGRTPPSLMNACGFQELRFVHIDGVVRHRIGCPIMSPSLTGCRVRGPRGFPSRLRWVKGAKVVAV